MYLTYLISSIIQIKTLENMQITLINKIKKINLLTFASFEQGKLFAMVVQESKVLSRVLARVVNGIRDIWLLIIYAFFRMTGLITRIPMQEHGLGYYLSLPIETILKFF